MKNLLALVAGLFSIFIIAAVVYGLYLAGGIELIIIIPIVGAADYFIIKKVFDK